MGQIYQNLSPDEITQLEFQAGKKAAEMIDKIISEKLNIQLSAEDNGKILQVGADGKVVPMTSSEGLTIDDTLSVSDSAADAKATGSAIAVSNSVISGDNLVFFSAQTKTASGVTFVMGSDGTVTANGTATANAICVVQTFTVPKAGVYHLSGCPSSGGSNKWYLKINTINDIDGGSGKDLTLEANTEYKLWAVVVNGKTAENVVFTPSLVYAGASLASLSNKLDSMMGYATPPLFYGGYSTSTGQVYHDNNESWMGNRVRTYPIYVYAGARIATSLDTYKLTVCRYADFDLTHYVETLHADVAKKAWTCPADGYYTITWKLAAVTSLTKEQVLTDWDFSAFRFERDERIHVNWIGCGNSDESSTYTNSGDCTFIVFPDGNNLLIDSANKGNYPTLRARLADAGFKRIDNIVISHFHKDHIGGLIQLVTGSVGLDISGATVYLPDEESTQWAYDNDVMESETKELYDEAMQMFEDNDCTLVYPDTDFKTYEIGGAALAFYNCDMSAYATTSTNYNDWSLCCYLFYGNMNVDFSGDLGTVAQTKLGGSLYKANVYKADHHGWLNNATMPKAYIENVSPDVVIALDGSEHDEKLPTDKCPLVHWCAENGVPYYRRYENGEIKMVVSKDSWAFLSKVTRYRLPATE